MISYIEALMILARLWYSRISFVLFVISGKRINKKSRHKLVAMSAPHACQEPLTRLKGVPQFLHKVVQVIGWHNLCMIVSFKVMAAIAYIFYHHCAMTA